MAATQFFLPPVSLWRLPSISSMEFLWGNVILPSLKGRQREKHQIPDVTGHRGLVLVVCKEQRYRVSVVTLLCFGQRQPQMLLQGKAREPEVCRRKLRSHKCCCCRRHWSHRGLPSCFNFLISGILFLADFLRWWYLYIPPFFLYSCFPSCSP